MASARKQLGFYGVCKSKYYVIVVRNRKDVCVWNVDWIDNNFAIAMYTLSFKRLIGYFVKMGENHCEKIYSKFGQS